MAFLGETADHDARRYFFSSPSAHACLADWAFVTLMFGSRTFATVRPNSGSHGRGQPRMCSDRLVIEEALDQAVARPPENATERLQSLANLRQAGADVMALADVAAAVLRRWPVNLTLGP